MDKFIIIDGNNLMFKAFYALPPLSNFEGVVSNAVFGFTNMMVKIIKEVNPKYIAVTFDVAKKNFRHEKFPEYKGTRKPTPVELIAQFPIMKDLLHKMNITVVEKEGLEADDLMGCLSRSFNTENIIVSGDRDSFQLINDNTSVMFPKKGVSETIILNKENLIDFYNVRPDQVIDLKSLMGDSSDNIPGISGVGEKTALTLIQKYDNLENIYNHIDEITGKLKDKLINEKEKAYLSQYLATIVTNENLGYKLEDFEYDKVFNKDVYNVFKKYQFNILLKKKELFVENVETIRHEVDAVKIDNLEKLNILVEDLKNLNEFYVYIDSENFNIHTTKEYKIELSKDLFSLGLDLNVVLDKLKPFFENENIKKTTFDCKSLKHFLHKFKIALNGVDFDCLIARYLINSIAKPNVGIKEVMLENNLDTDAFAYALKQIKEKYYAKLQEMNLLGVFYDIEMPLIDVLFNMEIQGFKVDKEELENLEIKYREEIKNLESEIYESVGQKFNISSPKQLGEILFDKLDLNIPSNKKKSTSIEILQEIEYKHPIISLIIRYRTITKLYNTYIIGFMGLIDGDSKIHTLFNQTLTSTGRLSSSEPNLQNIPVRTEEGRGLRKVFIPSNKNGFIVSADYSQIELRLMASFSGDDNLINAFNSGQDIHAKTASEIFGVPMENITPELRRKAKAINFGIIYGISDFGLSQNIGSSRKEAGEYIKLYYDRYPKLENYMKSNVDFCKENGYIKTIFGRIRPIPEASSNNHNVKTFGERAAMNMPLQGSASDIIKLAMVKTFNDLKQRNLQSKIILQVHDELVVDCYPGELELVKEILKENMENVVDLPVKLTVNIECGKTWYEAK